MEVSSTDFMVINDKIHIVCICFNFLAIMGVNIASLRIPLFILPVAGISLSVIIAFFAINEMLRIHRIKMSIKANIKFISSKFDEALKGNKFNNFIPIAVFIVQITLAIIIIIRIA